MMYLRGLFFVMFIPVFSVLLVEKNSTFIGLLSCLTHITCLLTGVLLRLYTLTKQETVTP